jgi:hypothetical protein
MGPARTLAYINFPFLRCPRRGPLPDLDRVRPHPGSGHGFGGRGGLLLLCPAGIGVERPLRLPAASSPYAHTGCSEQPHAAEADRKEAWAALKAGYGFAAQALGTRIQPAPHKPTASTAGYL